MHREDYRPNFLAFIQEITKLNNPAFERCDEWWLSGEPLNAVSLRQQINDEADRRLLHEIAQEFGLIALCPHELINIDVSGDEERITGVYVVSIFGRLYLKKRKPDA